MVDFASGLLPSMMNSNKNNDEVRIVLGKIYMGRGNRARRGRLIGGMEDRSERYLPLLRSTPR